jgi:hypothetical protein
MIVILEAHYAMQCGGCEDAVNEALTDIWRFILDFSYTLNSPFKLLSVRKRSIKHTPNLLIKKARHMR